MDFINERELERVAGDAGRELKAQPKVEIMIGQKPGSTHWEGGLNGYFFRIKRGVAVRIPAAIAELIAQNERVTRLSSGMFREYTMGRGKRLG